VASLEQENAALRERVARLERTLAALLSLLKKSGSLGSAETIAVAKIHSDLEKSMRKWDDDDPETDGGAHELAARAAGPYRSLGNAPAHRLCTRCGDTIDVDDPELMGAGSPLCMLCYSRGFRAR
jgi:hypothetical protein